MSSPSSAQPPAAENSCAINLGQAQQVRPTPALLRILQTAGAQGDTFTLKEVMHFLGQYILARRLFDPRQQHLVRCGADALGALLGERGFSLRDPSPVYEMLKRNLSAAAPPDAAQTLPKDQSSARPSPDQPKEQRAEPGTAEGRGKTSAGEPGEAQPSPEELPQPRQPKAELPLEEWDVAGLPWWFLGNLRSNYGSRSNGSTDIHTNQDVDTAIVSDTTDDLWFLNECPVEQGSAAAKGELLETAEGTESDTKVPEEVALAELEESQCLSDDTDTEPAAEDCWQCSKCRKFNSPGKRYCFRCWALRKDWFRDCPKIPHSLSLGSLPEPPEAVDVPDCRRTLSEPSQPKNLFLGDPKPRSDPGGSAESSDVEQRGKNRDFSGIKEEEEEESLESIRTLLSPCFLCQHRPRDGNIVHGRTAHLVACFRCARMLKRRRSPCPVCRKEIKMVIRIFMG